MRGGWEGEEMREDNGGDWVQAEKERRGREEERVGEKEKGEMG